MPKAIIARAGRRLMQRRVKRLKGIATQTLLALSVLTAAKGVNNFMGHKETWYNLPMNRIVQRAKDNNIPGEYRIREDGVKMYGDKIIVAANYKTHPYGSHVDTSLGKGIALDTGDFAKNNPEQVDIATAW